MIDVSDLRAFQHVGTQLSFSAAAHVLGVRTSAVSRSIQRLEKTLQVRLFERSTRRVVLTEAGETMLAEIDDIPARLDRFIDLAASLGKSPRGRLRISAVIGFGLEMLTDLIPDFADAYPKILISLDLSNRVVDLIAEQVDIGFRTGPLRDSSLVATRLGAIKCSLLASPAYLARRGTPEMVDDLARHDVLTMPRADGRPRQLPLCHLDGLERVVDPSARIVANDLHAICQMVVKGAGIAVMADFAVAAAIEGGVLVPVLPDWRPPALDVSIVMPGGRNRNPAVRAFVDFVRDRMTARRDWFTA